jgi:homogentisate 1,2-dioxygenase
MPSDTDRWAAEVYDLAAAMNRALRNTPADVLVAIDVDSLDLSTLNGEVHVPQLDIDLLRRITPNKETMQ